jgi:type I restriction enzyme S subunit
MNQKDNILPDGYRLTELGPLPEEWRVVRLGEVAQLVRGISWSKREQAANGIPVIAIPNVKHGLVSFDLQYRVKKKISEDKLLSEVEILLVGSSGSIQNVGRTAVVRRLPFEKATFASFLVKAVPISIERGYLYHLLCGGVVDYARCSKRAADGKYNLQVRGLKEHLIPLPPLPEQRAIAHVLQAVQRAREATERVIAATRELKKSLMRHLFTYGPVPVDQADQVPMQETDIGPIPAHWRVVRLGEVLTAAQYGLSERAGTLGKYPILRMNNLIDGQIDTSDLRYVRLDRATFERFCLRKGDLLFNRTNSYELVGKTALFELEGEYVFASYIIRLVVDTDQLLAEFLNYYLNYETSQNRLRMLASRGVSQSNISATKLKGFQVSLPPLSEQWEIARILQAADRKLAAEEVRKQALEALFHTLLHQLMTGKLRVVGLSSENPEESS